MKMLNSGNEMAGHNFEEILRVRGEAGRMEDQGRFITYFEGRLQQNVKVQGLQGCSRTRGL